MVSYTIVVYNHCAFARRLSISIYKRRALPLSWVAWIWTRWSQYQYWRPRFWNSSLLQSDRKRNGSRSPCRFPCWWSCRWFWFSWHGRMCSSLRYESHQGYRITWKSLYIYPNWMRLLQKWVSGPSILDPTTTIWWFMFPDVCLWYQS